MATVVFVHGIAQEQLSADVLEAQWTPALAGGLRLAGAPTLADRLRGPPGFAHTIDCRMAFYGDLFLRTGQQGSDSSPSDQKGVEEALAVEWLARIGARATIPKVRVEAKRQLSLASEPPSVEQGRHLRSAIAALARVPFLAHAGMELTSRFILKALRQVTLYLTDESIRHGAIDRVLKLVDGDTKVMIGHSLGSVVCYEVAHNLSRPLPLLVTIGSPLGLHSLVYERVVPQPPSFPLLVRRWVNVADPDDVVAADPELRLLFRPSQPHDTSVEDYPTVSNGENPHSAQFYLGKVETAKPVSQTLQLAI